MCDHLLIYRQAHQLQQRRPAWQCGTCGRVSSRPLDCCARPAFVSRVAPPGQRRRLWLGYAVVLWRYINLSGVLQWLGQAKPAGPHQHADACHAAESPARAVALEAAHDEVAAVENTPVGVGDRD